MYLIKYNKSIFGSNYKRSIVIEAYRLIKNHIGDVLGSMKIIIIIFYNLVLKYFGVFIAFAIVKIRKYRRSQKLERFNEVLNNENYESALWEINKYLEDKNDDSVALAYKGAILTKLGRADEAVQVLERAVTVEDMCYEARLALGEAYIAVGQLDYALIQYEKALKYLKSSEVYIGMANTYEAKGELRYSMGCCKKALKYEKKNKEKLLQRLVKLCSEVGTESEYQKYSRKLEALAQ